MGRLAATAVALVLLAACFGPDPNLTESGKGKPVIDVEFPPTVSPGEVATATLTVENPGPGDMGTIAVAFTTVGVAGASGPLPTELVPITTTSDNPMVAGITPEPRDVSPDGVVYYFDGVQEGGSLAIAFDIRVPETPGPAANSVSVYAGEAADRIRGVRLQTLVTG